MLDNMPPTDEQVMQPASQKIEISKEEVKYWQNEVKSSREFRKNEFVDRINYKKLIEYYEGFQRSDFQPSIDQLTIINEMYPGFSSIFQNINFDNLTINAKAKTPQAEGNLEPIQQFILLHQGMPPQIPLVELIKSALQYAVTHYDLSSEAELAKFDLCFAGFACIEVNHNVRKEYSHNFNKSNENAEKSAMQKIGSFVESLTDSVLGKKDDDVDLKVASEQSEESNNSKIDETYINWWNPLDILFDYRAKVFKRSRYVGKEKDYTLAEFKNDFPEFADKIPSQDYTPLKYAKHNNKDNSNVIRVVELQIKKTDGLYCLKITEGINEALDYYKHPVVTNGFTIKYTSLDNYGTLYPISRAKLAKKPQDELNHYCSLETEHADRSQKKIAYYSEGLTASGKEAIKSDDVYAFVEKKIPSQIFEPMPVGGVAPENKDLQELNRDNINKLIGTNELAKSGNSNSKFATQDALKNQQFKSNANSIELAMGRLLRDCLDTLKDIIMQFWDKDIFLKVTGLPNGDQWYTPDMGKLPDVLTGDYLVDIDVSSFKRRNPLDDKNELTELVMGLLKIEQFIASRGYKISISLIEEWIKSFNKNPKIILEKLEPMNQPGNPLPGGVPGGMPPLPSNGGSLPDSTPPGVLQMNGMNGG